MNNAPPVVFSEAKSPPMEIADVVKESPLIVGYVSFTVFEAHVKTSAPARRFARRRTLPLDARRGSSSKADASPRRAPGKHLERGL